MFKIDDTSRQLQPAEIQQNVDGSVGFPCPRASDIPNPLMTEYRKIMNSPETHQLTLTKDCNPVFGQKFDSYQVDDGFGTVRIVTVTAGESPRETDSIAAISGNNLQEETNNLQVDTYDKGERNSAMFRANEKSKWPISAWADFMHSTTGDFISETGSIYTDKAHPQTPTGSFDAEFDSSKKLISFKAGMTRDDMTDRMSACEEKK